MTWREIIYIITDLTKTMSDDNQFNEDHIKFLCGKYRNYIINSQYGSEKKHIPDTNYQTFKIDLERVQHNDICPNTVLLRSSEPIPFMMPIGEKIIYPSDMFGVRSKLVLVPSNRFQYVDSNKYTKNIIYGTIGPDNYLYLRSCNRNFMFLNSVEIKGLFEDIEKASMLDASTCRCDIMDTRFPLEDAWVNTLINLVITDLTRGIYTLRDTNNDAFDSSDQLAQAIQRYTTNSFKNMLRNNNNAGS